MDEPQALWFTAERTVALRQARLAPRTGDVVVAARHSAISRGTERLVFHGLVPESEYERMRCPMQEGSFPFPVKYGYSMVGQVESGPEELTGRMVFVLHPHQSRFSCPQDTVLPIPDSVPAQRAVLAANMETALTILWDSGIGAGDRIAVVGAGVVGALAARLAARVPGTDVTLVDVNPDRETLAVALSCRFALPDAAQSGQDVVIHASATATGLQTSVRLAGEEGLVVEASWYGSNPVTVALGGAFHSKRLRIASSQVGRIPPGRVPRWTHSRRMRTALALLEDSALDVLLSGVTQFRDLPDAYAGIIDDPATLCHRITY